MDFIKTEPTDYTNGQDLPLNHGHFVSPPYTDTNVGLASSDNTFIEGVHAEVKVDQNGVPRYFLSNQWASHFGQYNRQDPKLTNSELPNSHATLVNVLERPVELDEETCSVWTPELVKDEPSDDCDAFLAFLKKTSF